MDVIENSIDILTVKPTLENAGWSLAGTISAPGGEERTKPGRMVYPLYQEIRTFLLKTEV